MTTPAYRLAPWTTVVRPHEDVTGGALDMGTYAANLAGVFRRHSGVPEVYARPDRFFAGTYLTSALRKLLGDVLRVLGGGAGDRVLQLRTPFGGGKTHTLVALLHLARDRAAAAAAPDFARLPDPGPVQVAVLSGEELDPLSPMKDSGVETHTLWGELAAQLGRYHLVAEHDGTGSSPGGETLRQVLGDGPVVVLLDEVLVYVEKAMALQRGESNAGRQAMLFVQALTEVVNTHPHAAMVYSLQASVGEAVGAEGLLTQLDHLVSRIDAKREPVSGDEVMRVVQRRLFADLGDADVQRTVARVYADLLRRQLEAYAETEDARRQAATEAGLLEERILASYPFHPELLDLMYHRWGSLPSYQRTRGALQFLASTVHALWHKGTNAPLIGPGEVDLADEATRGAFFSQVGERERYTSVLSSDITSAGSGAVTVNRRLGADSATIDQLAVGSRVATAIMLYSFGAREGEDRGVLEADLVAAVLTPGLDRNVLVAALHDLREEELYLHYAGRRYRFEPTPNLMKLVRDEANKFTTAEVLDKVREQLEEHLKGTRGVVIWPEGPGGIDDGKPLFSVAYLHPDWTPERTPLEAFVEQARSGPRRYRNGVALVLPDATQLDQARQSTRSWLAAQSLLRQKAKYGFTAEQFNELKEKAEASQRSASTAVSRGYASVALPVKDRSGQAPYVLETVDLRSLLTAGRSLHERVEDALSQRVFSSLTVEKLTTLAGLSPTKPAVSLGDLLDWFYSYFDFTKVWSRRVLAETVSNAVVASRAGYAVGLIHGDDTLEVRDPKLIRIGELLPSDEIDLSTEAALLETGYAQRLLNAATAPAGTAGAEVAPTTLIPVSSRPGGEPESTTTPAVASGGPTSSARGESVARVDLKATIGKTGFFDLNRALSWLRDHAAKVNVEVTIHAEAGEPGFDRVQLRNGVIEPLEEGGTNLGVDMK
jgi:Protein of unknown function (DUF499)